MLRLDVAALGHVVGERVGGHVLGVVDAADDDRPVGVPSSKATTTSWPTRGIWMVPHWAPAHEVATRIQQELSALFWPWRSQGNWTLIAPVLVGEDLVPRIADDDGCLGAIDPGRGTVRSGRNGRAAGMHWNVFE